MHAHGVDLEFLGALEHRVVHAQPARLEDQVDEHAVVVGLDEPVLGRPLGLHAGLLEGLEARFPVLGPDEEVDVVVGLGPSARPTGEAAAEEERHMRALQRARGLAQRLEDAVERFRLADHP